MRKQDKTLTNCCSLLLFDFYISLHGIFKSHLNGGPSVSKMYQKDKVFTLTAVIVSNSICLSEFATVTKGGRGLPIGQLCCFR